jgi:CRISPR-associated protein Csx17
VASDPQVALSGDLDGWRQRLCSSADTTAPAQIRSLRRRLDGALFELSSRPNPLSARRLLGLVAQTERATARSSTFRRAAGDAAVPRLRTRWAQILDDGSVEFAVASRLAAGWESDPTVRHRCLAELLRPVRRNDRGDLILDPDGPEVPGLGERPLCTVLADAAVRRAVTGPAPSPDDQPAAIRGRWIQFPIAQPRSVLAQRRWVEALASEDLDERLLNEHLAACLLVDPQALGTYQPQAAQAGPARPSPMWRLLAPWFSRRPIPLDTQRGETAQRPEDGMAGPPAVRDVFIPVTLYHIGPTTLR